jgi:hypothetical protein
MARSFEACVSCVFRTWLVDISTMLFDKQLHYAKSFFIAPGRSRLKRTPITQRRARTVNIKAQAYASSN